MEMITLGILNLVPATVRWMVLAYLGFKGLDMLLGILKSWKNNNYKSAKMREGIVRWVAEMVAIVFVITIDFILGINFYLCGFTLSLFIYKEAGSILENLTECGVELPTVVAEKLEVFNKKGE